MSSSKNEDNNNRNNLHHKSATESLLSQALENKPQHSASPLRLRSNLSSDFGIAQTADNDSASDTTSERPDSIMDNSDSAATPPVRNAGHAPGANSFLPPGLEALYRQAGFPSAFLGLASGSGGGQDGSRASSTASGATSASASATSSAIQGMTPPIQHGGLQSHAGNPNCK